MVASTPRKKASKKKASGRSSATKRRPGRPAEPRIGRPPKINDPQEAQKLGDAYFDKLEIDKKNPTITGLAYALGLSSRANLANYRAKPEFEEVIGGLTLRVEMFYEERLSGPSAGGAIFALKNFGWSDNQKDDGDRVVHLTIINGLKK